MRMKLNSNAIISYEESITIQNICCKIRYITCNSIFDFENSVKKKNTKLLQNVLPPINLDVLSIKEEDRGGNQGDVKILGIHWNLVDVNNEDPRHVGKLCCTLGKLE